VYLLESAVGKFLYRMRLSWGISYVKYLKRMNVQNLF